MLLFSDFDFSRFYNERKNIITLKQDYQINEIIAQDNGLIKVIATIEILRLSECFSLPSGTLNSHVFMICVTFRFIFLPLTFSLLWTVQPFATAVDMRVMILEPGIEATTTKLIRAFAGWKFQVSSNRITSQVFLKNVAMHKWLLMICRRLKQHLNGCFQMPYPTERFW